MSTAKFLAEAWLASTPTLQLWKGLGRPMKLENSELKGETTLNTSHHQSLPIDTQPTQPRESPFITVD